MLLLLAACGSGGGGDAEQGAEASSTGGTEGMAQAVARTPSESCAEAPAVSQGRFLGTLRDTQSDPAVGGACGGGGPDVFMRLEVPLRADLRVEARGNGFTPRVSLAPLGCLAGPQLACGGDGIAELVDLGEGTQLMLVIGVDPDTFAALGAVPQPEDGPDPLGFTLDVTMTRVLADGEVCLPEVRGRCASGTLCMPEPIAGTGTDTGTDTDSDSEGADDARWLCTELAGDRCDDPERVTVVLKGGLGSVSVDPDRPQTDAHRSSCTGGGTRERVLRLRLPAGLDARQALQIHADRPEVGLAVRAPGCLGSDEIACAAPSAGGSRVTIDEPAQLQQAGVEPYLLVELPEPGVLAEPVVLHLRQVQVGPPLGTP